MKKHIWKLLSVFALTLFLGAGSQTFAKEEEVLTTGLYIEDIEVSGMTADEAYAAIDAYVAEKGEGTIFLTVEDQQVEVALKDLGLSYTNSEIVQDAMQFGRKGNLIKRYKERKDLEHEPKVYSLQWQVDRDMVQAVVEEASTEFDVGAVDAGLKKTGSGFEVIPGTTGVSINVENSTENIVSYIENEWQQGQESIALAAEVEEPKGTAEELSKVKDVLGTFTTSYSTSGANRSLNIASGAEHINGTVLYPGETFSTYEVVSPFTAKNGYAMAGSYLNGKTVDSMGGGICQVSTTLYNAVLRAELEVVERSPHSMTVSYVDPSADAAIAGTYKDLKFKNNTDAPIYIEGVTSGKKVTFTIYGQETRPSNRTIKFVSQTLSTTDPGMTLVADPGQGLGYRKVSGGHVGLSAELYKHVYINGVEQSVEKVNKSKYSASAGTITYGTAGDPDLSNQLQAAIATGDQAAADAIQSMCLAAISQ